MTLPESTPTADGRRVHTVAPDRLARVGARPGFVQYLRSLWAYRSFIVFDSRSRIAGGNSVNALGRVWMVLNPILNGATYFFVFGLLLGTGKGIPNFIAYLIIGVFLFRYTTSAITAGSRAIAGNLAIVRAFRFPRATLVLATNMREFMVFIPTLITMFVLILVIPPLEEITALWLLIVPLLALQTLFNVGLSMLLARIVARWPDFSNLIGFGTRIWLYLSAVFFSIERFENHPLMVTFMHLNPMYCVLDIARESLLYGEVAAPERWLVLIAWTVVLLVVGTLVFWQAEETYGEER